VDEDGHGLQLERFAPERFPAPHALERRLLAVLPALGEARNDSFGYNSLEFMQPNNITLMNADGINVPFGSSDIKALLTYYIAEYNTMPTPFIAGRCNVDIHFNRSQEYTLCWFFLSSRH
jgi:hypothetical protein